MRVPAQRRQAQKVEHKNFPAPTAGWISNRNFAMAEADPLAPGAFRMVNFFPAETGAVLRRGNSLHSEPDIGSTIRTMFTYTNVGETVFASSDNGIWDVTLNAPQLMPVTVTAGDWSTVEFSNAGGSYLIGVNGVDPGFIYDGSSFTELTLTGVNSSDLSHVWVYKERLYFIEKGTLNAWYLDLYAISGDATLLPLGSVFSMGGSLLFGENWSLSSSGSGGLSEQCIFVSDQGQVAAYGGLNPGDTSWTQVGVYRIGVPLGKHAYIRAGGDILIASSLGFISLERSIGIDYSMIGAEALSDPISDDWTRAVNGTLGDWRCELWSSGSLVMVAPKESGQFGQFQFIANAQTGAWAIFTGWDVASVTSARNRLFFGTKNGEVFEAMVGGSDNGASYTGSLMPLYSSLGDASRNKIAKHARVTTISNFSVNSQVVARADFDNTFPPPPSGTSSPESSSWDVGKWDEAVWNSGFQQVREGRWASVGGAGSDLSVATQITSGSVTPSDAKVVRIDLTYVYADTVT